MAIEWCADLPPMGRVQTGKEVEVFNFRFKEYPVLLLDDALSELDSFRRARVLERTKGIQTIITCTEADDISVDSVNKITVQAGKIVD